MYTLRPKLQIFINRKVRTIFQSLSYQPTETGMYFLHCQTLFASSCKLQLSLFDSSLRQEIAFSTSAMRRGQWSSSRPGLLDSKGNSPPVGLCVFQSECELCCIRTFLVPCQNRTQSLMQPASSLVTIRTELPRIRSFNELFLPFSQKSV